MNDRVARQRGNRLAVKGGIASAVIDFSKGGPDDPPIPKHVKLPPWPALVGHRRPDDRAIYVPAEQDVLSPHEPVDLRCSGCVPRTEIALDSDTETIVFLVHHLAGFQAVADMLAIAGRL